MIGWILAMATAVLILWMVWFEPGWLKLRVIPLELGFKSKRPLKILHLSDTHFPLQLKVLRRFFKQLEAVKPDLVVITGDLIEYDAGISVCAEAVKSLNSRLGTYAVLGNHDHFSYGLFSSWKFALGMDVRSIDGDNPNDTARLKRELKDAGCRVLENENLILEHEGQSICLIGLDDPVTRQADVAKAFEGAEPADLRVLLAHSVDVLPIVGEKGVHLTLSGHTHGGQLGVPFYGALPMRRHCRLGRRYVAGLHRYGATITHTSRGLGVGRFFRFRFLCRPEASILEIS